MGRLWTSEDFKNRYAVDDVKFVDEVSNYFIYIFLFALNFMQIEPLLFDFHYVI